ncbi:MAG: UDP-N-acetylmuramoyl-L-alanine--D-glutamate ligase [candidate division WOR-3 bacterium]
MKKIGIIGAKRAGTSCALLLNKLGYKIFLSEIKKIPSYYKKKLPRDIYLEEGINSDKILMNDLIIASPGVSEKERIIKRIREKGIPLVDEIEIGYRFIEGKIVAITGTNGKSTVTKWIYECLKDDNKVYMGGNIGTPLTEFAFKKGTFIVEVSSFELKRIKFFRPYIGIILNIDKDHIDWHIDLDDYISSKFNIFKNQNEEDFLIIDEEIELKGKIKPKVFKVSLKKEVEGIFLKNDKIIINIQGCFEEVKINFPLNQNFNIKNGLFVLLTLKILGKNLEDIKEKFEKFRGLPHRLEYIGEKNGIKVFNDSKSTNPHSVKNAIESFEENIILLMGGLNKGLSFKEIKKLIKKKCKGIVLFGKSRFEILKDIEDKEIKIEMAEKVEDALKIAFKMAKKDDIILFSPGCASFDMYKNYEERGEDFKNAFKRI